MVAPQITERAAFKGGNQDKKIAHASVGYFLILEARTGIEPV
jgi:hypothetical protein